MRAHAPLGLKDLRSEIINSLLNTDDTIALADEAATECLAFIIRLVNSYITFINLPLNYIRHSFSFRRYFLIGLKYHGIEKKIL